MPNKADYELYDFMEVNTHFRQEVERGAMRKPVKPKGDVSHETMIFEEGRRSRDYELWSRYVDVKQEIERRTLIKE